MILRSGQHFPGHSVLHRCDPRLKLIQSSAAFIVLFVASNPLGITLSLAMLVLLYRVAQIPLKLILKSLKPIVPLIVFTAVLNLFFVSGRRRTAVAVLVCCVSTVKASTTPCLWPPASSRSSRAPAF